MRLQTILVKYQHLDLSIVKNCLPGHPGVELFLSKLKNEFFFQRLI